MIHAGTVHLKKHDDLLNYIVQDLNQVVGYDWHKAFLKLLQYVMGNLKWLKRNKECINMKRYQFGQIKKIGS